MEWESGRITLVGRRIVIVFSRGEVERWRTAANCFLTGLTRFTRLLLARYENENLMRKILKGNGEWGECTRERVNV